MFVDTHFRIFDVIPKKGLHVLKYLHRNFSGRFGEIWANILRTPKHLLAPTLMVHTDRQIL